MWSGTRSAKEAIAVSSRVPRKEMMNLRRALHLRALAHERRQSKIVDLAGAEHRQLFQDQHFGRHHHFGGAAGAGEGEKIRALRIVLGGDEHEALALARV